MNKTLGDQLKQMTPKAGEIWLMKTEYVVMHDKNAEPMKKRPLLILSSKELIKQERTILNVIPITATPRYDSVTVPVRDAYRNLHEDFKPKNSATAILALYQPILREYLLHRAADLEDSCYYAIRRMVIEKIIGHKLDDFDVTI